MSDLTDTVLLRACRRGDEAAARALYARLGPMLLVYARTVLRDDMLAEDAVQNAFCRLFGVPVREVDRVGHAAAWLAAIVRREALTIIRSHRRILARNRRFAQTRGEVRVEPPRADDLDELRALGERVAALPRRVGEVIVLRHVCALTFDEMALALGANRNTIASRYREAIQKLESQAARPRRAEEKNHVERP
ncbi:MAG: sigma-70 family RNA polymerase sigma factor [Planctomycetota bacterium]|nr:sigma-70 family RNA polymerase sigma factor [Planctomycetota bacterium]